MNKLKWFFVAMSLILSVATLLAAPVALEAAVGDPAVADEGLMAVIDMVSDGVAAPWLTPLDTPGLVNPATDNGGMTTVAALPAAAPSSATIVVYWTYTVKRGDTLSALARRYGTTITKLAQVNHIRNVNRIYVGQRLKIPKVVSVSTDNGGTSEPATGDVFTAICNPLISITSPQMNQTLSASSVQIKGSASLPAGFDPGSSGFSFYKVEYGVGERPILWYVIGETHANTVSNDVLETWDTSAQANGVYRLRLYAVSSRGNFPPPCEVRVVLQK